MTPLSYEQMTPKRWLPAHAQVQRKQLNYLYFNYFFFTMPACNIMQANTCNWFVRDQLTGLKSKMPAEETLQLKARDQKSSVRPGKWAPTVKLQSRNKGGFPMDRGRRLYGAKGLSRQIIGAAKLRIQLWLTRKEGRQMKQNSNW